MMRSVYAVMVAAALLFIGCGSSDKPEGAKQKPKTDSSKALKGSKSGDGKAVDGNRISAIGNLKAMEQKKDSEAKRIDETAKTSGIIKTGESARIFQGKTFDGKELNLADYKGKYVLLDFWATWCRPCQAELPFLGKLAEKYKGSDKFAIIGISLDSDPAKIPPFIQRFKIDYPHMFDGKVWQNTIAQQYGVNSIPFTVLLDPEMKVTHVGLRGENLIQTIETLIK